MLAVPETYKYDVNDDYAIMERKTTSPLVRRRGGSNSSTLDCNAETMGTNPAGQRLNDSAPDCHAVVMHLKSTSWDPTPSTLSVLTGGLPAGSAKYLRLVSQGRRRNIKMCKILKITRGKLLSS